MSIPRNLASTFILSLVLSLSAIPTAIAQQAELQKAPQGVRVVQGHDLLPGEKVIHRTPQLVRSAESQAALAEYKRMKTAGVLPKSGSQAVTPGSEKSFQLLDFTTCNGPGGCQPYNETFTLAATGTLFNIWIANTDLAANGGQIVESDWQEFAIALGDETPSDSWNANLGIIEIDNMVFGPPSDIDQNGKIEVLIHDIRDGYDGVNNLGFTVGYYSPSDLNAPNRADIIHLDSSPAIYRLDGSRRSSSLTLATLAHEYQHLIFAVQHGSNDLTFIDEGLAEWAEVVNGYSPRTVSYLGETSEIARPMLDWRSDPYGGARNQDYQRAGLFHHYLAERLSTEIVGEIARGSGIGVGNYTKMLTDNFLDASFLEELVQGFHVANVINDQSLNPAFGYASPFRSGIKASAVQTIDGTQSNSSAVSVTALPSGAVRYLRWTQVGDFNLDISATSGANRLSPVLVMKPAGGQLQRAEPEVGGEPLSISGEFDEIHLIVPHVDLTTSSTASFVVNANWEDFAGNSQLEVLTYDSGTAATDDGGLLVAYALGGSQGYSITPESEFANQFVIPTGAALTSVDVAVLFMSDVGVDTATNTRDLVVKVYADLDGDPGELLVSKEVLWTSGSSTGDLTYQTVDFSDEIGILENAQGPIYVSIADLGSDDNHVIVPMANSATSDLPSYLFTTFGNSGLGWAPFDDITSGGQSVFDGQVAPIRATIDLMAGSTDTEDADVLPRTLTLEQNYPNPFNPSTQIRFSLPQTEDVQLQVFDLLGRNVATLVNSTLPAGQHEVSFDASDLTSGLYLYTIATPSRRISRTMTLIK